MTRLEKVSSSGIPWGLFSGTISHPCLTIRFWGCSSEHFGEAFSWDNQIFLYWPITTSHPWNTSPSPRSVCMWPHYNSIVFVFPDPSILFSPFPSRYLVLWYFSHFESSEATDLIMNTQNHSKPGAQSPQRVDHTADGSLSSCPTF